MLQQTRVSTVIPYYTNWLRRFPDFGSLARASEDDVLHAWQGLGYYARARNLHITAKIVLDQNQGHFPRSVDEMQQLPGIGKYTAHAVASFAFNQSLPIVEANTARVLTRLFDFRKAIDSEVGCEALWRYAATLVPKSNAWNYNSALLDLGALVCIPRQPKCGICPMKKFCRAKNPAALPIKKPGLRPKRLIEKHALVVRRGRILLEQSSSRWRGMWILPPVKPGSFKHPNFHGRAIYTSVFPFTTHQVAFKVYAGGLRKIDSGKNRVAVANKNSQRWIRIESLDSVPMPSPHRRAMRHLLSEPAAARPHRQQSSGS